MRLRTLWLVLLLLCSHFCWADVVFTDQEFQELEQIMDQLETLNSEQQMIIDSLQTRNNELQIQSEDKQKILDEQRQTLEMQEVLLKEEKKSSTEKTILSNIITAIISFIIGAFVW